MIPPTPPKAAPVPPPQPIIPPIPRAFVPPVIPKPAKSQWKFPVLIALTAIFVMIMRLITINKSIDESNVSIQKARATLEESMRLQKQEATRKKLLEQEEAKKRLLEKSKAEEQERLALQEEAAFDQTVAALLAEAGI